MQPTGADSLSFRAFSVIIHVQNCSQHARVIIRQTLLLPEQVQNEVADVLAQRRRVLILKPVLAKECWIWHVSCTLQAAAIRKVANSTGQLETKHKEQSRPTQHVRLSKINKRQALGACKLIITYYEYEVSRLQQIHCTVLNLMRFRVDSNTRQQ